MDMNKRQREKLIRALRAVVGQEGVLTSPADLMLYEFDASLERARPEVVVLPSSGEQVSEVVRLANQEGVPFVARGAGTGLSGGSLPVQGGLVISLARLNRILEIDLPNRAAVVEPGVVNLELNNALARHGYWFAPDPASQRACTIGGNVGENAGGPHCLKYGVTTNHILGLEVVLPDGQVVQAGGKAPDWPGYDLTGLLVGSEGTLGIVTKITVRISPRPESLRTMLASFASIEEASNAVSAIIAAGILPSTLEMMDRLVIQAVEDSFQAGYPRDAGAILFIEVDGLVEGLDRQAQRIAKLCHQQGAQEVHVAQSEEERERLWLGRRGAPIAINRLSPHYILADGTVPRTRLPEVLRRVGEIGQRYSFPIGNLFHAGDGNLHPLILFDGTSPGERERALQASYEILKACIEAGGTISGEHGIGLEKALAMKLVFDPDDLSLMEGIKAALDPQGLCNPGKVFPPNHEHQA
jgi:glycolate oxidase